MDAVRTKPSPTTGSPPSQGLREQKECLICFAPIEATNRIKTRCDHTLHKSCMYVALAKRHACPCCNQLLIGKLSDLPELQQKQYLMEVLHALGQKVDSYEEFQKELDQGLIFSVDAYSRKAMKYWLEKGANIPDEVLLKEKYSQAVKRGELCQAQALKKVFPLQLKGIDL